MGLPKDCIFLSHSKATWTGDCKNLDLDYSCDLDFSLDSNTWITARSLENERNSLDYDDDELCSKIDQSRPDDSETKSCCHGNTDLLPSERFCDYKNSPHGLNDSLKDSTSPNQKQNDFKDLSCTVIKDTCTQVNVCQEPSGLLGQTDTFIHGFVGYFTSVLYKDIMIDTRHTSRNRNSFHWECYFVPLSKPILVEHDSKVKIRMTRKCEESLKEGSCYGMKLWYEWQVLVENRNILDYVYVPHEPHSKYQKEEKSRTTLNNTATTLSLNRQNKCSTTKISNEFEKNSRKNSNHVEPEEDSLCCERKDSHSLAYKFPVQNRNGEVDAVVLTWA
jgi:hypothetical protein